MLPGYEDFAGYLTPGTSEYYRRRSEFRRSMKESRVALCPESIPGVFPYRFWEAMSAGRVPVLVGNNYVLPWEQDIPYSEFCLFVATVQATQTGEMVREYLNRTSDAELIEKGKRARHYWEEWLQPDLWASTMRLATERKLRALSLMPA